MGSRPSVEPSRPLLRDQEPGRRKACIGWLAGGSFTERCSYARVGEGLVFRLNADLENATMRRLVKKLGADSNLGTITLDVEKPSKESLHDQLEAICRSYIDMCI